MAANKKLGLQTVEDGVHNPHVERRHQIRQRTDSKQYYPLMSKRASPYADDQPTKIKLTSVVVDELYLKLLEKQGQRDEKLKVGVTLKEQLGVVEREAERHALE